MNLLSHDCGLDSVMSVSPFGLFEAGRGTVLELATLGIETVATGFMSSPELTRLSCPFVSITS
jgi:hypothetical protein